MPNSTPMNIRIASTENQARIHHYASVVEAPGFEWLGTLATPYDEKSLAGVDALIVSSDHYLPSRVAIASCKRLGIPTFHVLDGVLDWRTSFENPEYDLERDGLPLYQPLICDHVFAMGVLQKQELNWLGNDCVHATGLPRFDALARNSCRRGRLDARPRILVATANTPWVTDEQKKHLVSQFAHLHTQLAKGASASSGGLWTYRISQELASELGIRADFSGSATQAIGQADVVVTTPSTFAIESMLAGVPTLIFDPFGFPVLTPAAWSATSWETVLRLLPSLLSPTEPLAAYQDYLCSQLVAPGQQAASRIAAHIRAVVGKQTEGEEAGCTQTDSACAPVAALANPFDHKNWTDAQVSSLETTISLMDRQMAELRTDYHALLNTHSDPNFRNVLGLAKRYLSGSGNRLKKKIRLNASRK